VWEHQGEVKRLTEWWLVDVDARKEALRGGVISAEEEDIDEARCRVGSGRRRFKWSCGIARRLQERAIGRGVPGSPELRGTEEVGGGRLWRRVSSTLRENGEEGVGEWDWCGARGQRE